MPHKHFKVYVEAGTVWGTDEKDAMEAALDRLYDLPDRMTYTTPEIFFEPLPDCDTADLDECESY